MNNKAIRLTSTIIIALTLLVSAVSVGFAEKYNTPKHIVSLYPSITEIIFALGKGDNVIGVSDYCNYPEAAVKLPKLGGLTINAEKIIGLKPDIILMHKSQSKSNETAINLFKNAKINVQIIGDANSFDDAYRDIKTIGKAIGANKQAVTLISNMKSKVANIKQKSMLVKTKKKVWVEVDTWGGLWTTGRYTFMDEMLNTLGAINVAKPYKGWISLTEEKVVELRPQVIIITYGDFDKEAIKHVLDRKGWQNIPAVKNKQVFNVNSDSVVRPGPRLIDGVEALAKAIYPDIYSK